MRDMFLFIRHGWKSIWKQKAIWLFSAVAVFNQLYNTIQVTRPTDLPSSLISLTASLILMILFYVSYIGVPYLAYRFLIGKPATIQETLSAVKKISGRVLGCSFLGFLVVSPFLFWALVVSINSSTRSIELSNTTLLAFLPLSIFYALWQFTLVGFFENDWGIRQSLGRAWGLFKNYFGVLAVIGLLLTITFRAYSALSGTLTVLIQSGFDLSSVSTINLLNPSASLGTNLLFVLINGIGQIVFIPLSASIFISAYLKYNDARLPSQMRVR